MFKKLFLRTLGKIIPSDVFSHRFPVSVKGVCFIGDKVILLKNERNEWDLPGGKLKKKENIQSCLIREIEEELSILVQPKQLLRAITVNMMDTIEVFVVIYGCLTLATINDLKISEESFGIGAFPIGELDQLDLLPSYREVIKLAHKALV